MRRIFILLFGISALILCIAYAAEYLFHLKACKLCQLQRIPYFLLITGSIFGLYTSHKMIVLRILQACLVLGFFVACYHSAVVFGLVNDPCLANPRLDDIESFKAVIEKAIPCSASVWKPFHIPASIFNALLSMSLLLVIQMSKRKFGFLMANT